MSPNPAWVSTNQVSRKCVSSLVFFNSSDGSIVSRSVFSVYRDADLSDRYVVYLFFVCLLSWSVGLYASKSVFLYVLHNMIKLILDCVNPVRQVPEQEPMKVGPIAEAVLSSSCS